MSMESRVNVRWTVLAVGGLGLLAVGAGATYVRLRSQDGPRHRRIRRARRTAPARHAR